MLPGQQEAEGRKAVVIDTGHLQGMGGTAEWVWKCHAAGANPIFMDPYLSNIWPAYPEAEAIRHALGETRRAPLPA